MNSSGLEYKLKKYTYKLKNAKNRREAELYQQKLQHYHSLNRTQRGGDGHEEAIKIADKAFEETVKRLQNNTNPDVMNKLKERNQAALDLFEELKKSESNLCDNNAKFKDYVERIIPEKLLKLEATSCNINTEEILNIDAFKTKLCSQKGSKEESSETKPAVASTQKETNLPTLLASESPSSAIAPIASLVPTFQPAVGGPSLAPSAQPAVGGPSLAPSAQPAVGGPSLASSAQPAVGGPSLASSAQPAVGGPSLASSAQPAVGGPSLASSAQPAAANTPNPMELPSVVPVDTEGPLTVKSDFKPISTPVPAIPTGSSVPEATPTNKTGGKQYSIWW
ncbi:hypothetical protein QKU48_gp0772 [Fadolivirus algeromassiliense]|uniref:Uncharacterized protein n=1 Tax=Fadolivirus FV1/VV64 TaxID=3070911 RepID=A0A7D3UTE0_9VIRU|nr:hypothetical protein QKU48_gp0772 [Fadolivirus algeromassiliense]QKF94230.1 hypothetical protein Fadolivirus_1_772 [Fadolivirus FV1/VV64]